MNKILLILVSLVAMSCSTTRVENATLVPAVQSAWPGVRYDIEQAPTQPQPGVLDAVEFAIEGGNRSLIRAINWPDLQVLALSGIDAQLNDGRISAGVALSLIERVGRFRDGLEKLQEVF